MLVTSHRHTEQQLQKQERWGAGRHNQQVVTAPLPLQGTKNPSHTEGPFYFSYCTLGEICEVKISQFEHSSIQGFPKVDNHLTHLESSVCILPRKTLIW